MLALRFGLMDDVFGAHFHAAPAATTTTGPLQLCEGLAPSASPEWRGTQMRVSTAVKSALGACCGDVFVSTTAATIDPAMDDDSGEQDGAAPSFAFGDSEDFDEDFDLGPPPPCGPVLVRQRAMDCTVAREAKAATLARKLDATPSSATALRSARLIPPSSSSAAGRSRHFAGV